MVCKKVSHSLNLLRRLSWFLPQPLLLLYLKSYILPHFDYCDVVWIGCTKAESLLLESSPNFACRTVLHRCKLSSASLFKKKFPSCANCLQVPLFPSPTYLSQLFLTPSSSYHTQSSSSQLNLPAVKSSYGQRAFSFAGASVWRSLSAATRQIRDFQAFSAKCKDLLIWPRLDLRSASCFKLGTSLASLKHWPSPRDIMGLVAAWVVRSKAATVR